jgi:AhpD family alkylhydroperoxidase
MPRTAAPKPEQVPADSKPTLDMFTKNIGFTPNMLATFALSPIAFNSWATLLGSLSKALDVKTRDSIGLAVSEVNGCNYCLTVHSFTAERQSSAAKMRRGTERTSISQVIVQITCAG